MKYILGILGSPRIGGNTDILLDKALEGAKSQGAETEKIVLNNLKFSPCQECENLRGDGACIIEDDMQPLFKKIKKADAVIIASPIFFGSLSAQTKMMIDRFQCAWLSKFVLKKNPTNEKRPGAFISVEASKRKDFFDNAKSIVKNFFAVAKFNYKEELLCPEIDEKGKILKYPKFLKKALELGEKLAKGG